MFICFYLFQNGSVDKINKTAFLDIKEPSWNVPYLSHAKLEDVYLDEIYFRWSFRKLFETWEI
jgi:hypothetical protein